MSKKFVKPQLNGYRGCEVPECWRYAIRKCGELSVCQRHFKELTEEENEQSISDDTVSR